MKKSNPSQLEKKLGYKFTNKHLLTAALTHKTYAFEAQTPLEYNDRFRLAKPGLRSSFLVIVSSIL